MCFHRGTHILRLNIEARLALCALKLLENYKIRQEAGIKALLLKLCWPDIRSTPLMSNSWNIWGINFLPT